MKERSFDEMIAYFNRRVSEMDIARDYKIELLGMITALGYKHEKSVPQWIPCNKCRYYVGVHDVQGHAPCSFWNVGGVLWNDSCKRAEPWVGEK